MVFFVSYEDITRGIHDQTPGQAEAGIGGRPAVAEVPLMQNHVGRFDLD